MAKCSEGNCPELTSYLQLEMAEWVERKEEEGTLEEVFEKPREVTFTCSHGQRHEMMTELVEGPVPK